MSVALLPTARVPAVALLVSLGLLWPAGAAAQSRLLVAVGNNEGLAQEIALRHASRDARRVEQLLTSIGGVEGELATVLVDRSVADLKRELGRVERIAAARARRDKRPPVLFFYYSGHGDRDHLHLAGERLSLATLKQALARIPASLRVVVIDACRTERQRSKGVTVDARPFTIDLRAPAGPRGVVLVHSSSAGETAQESDDLGGAVFTHYLLSGLRGGADRDGDRRVTFAEAYAYAYHRTLRRSAASSGPLQRPSVEIELEGAGPLVITRTARAGARLRLPRGKDTHYLVYAQPAGTLVAEAWSSPRRRVALALPRGRFLVQRRAGGRSGAREVWLPYGGEHDLDDGDFTPLPPQLLASKGGRLILRRHRLTLGYGASLGTRVSSRLGHRLELRYGFALRGPWMLGAGVAIGLADHDTGALAVDERFAEAQLVGSWQRSLGPLALVLEGGGALRVIHQRRERLDAERLRAAGYDAAPATDTALAGGPLVGTRLAIPLTGRWALAVGVRFEALLLRRGDKGIGLDFNGIAESGLQVAF